MDLQLDSHVVLVVGGTGLIGTAVADRLRQEGATVVVASRHVADGVVMDTADDRSVADGVAHVLREHGKIDALVVAAAPAASTLDPELNSDPTQVLSAIDGKAMGFLRVALAVIPGMRDAGYGRIIALSGQNAYITGNITGSVRNAAITLVAKNLGDQLAGTGVAVNSVSPAVVAEEPKTEVAKGAGGQSSPTQIADLIAFLTSPLSAVSGESIAIGHRMLGATTL